jgi:flavin reductase (DIM6/NTAB) family NADH-FMN oxidoreductase RutF
LRDKHLFKKIAMKDLGAKAFSYGYACPVLMVGTYNDDGSVNVMNLHECARTNAGHLACCIGKSKKTHENIEKRHAFTLTLANEKLMAAVDYMGTVSGYQVPDKFTKAGLKAEKSKFVDAPIIVGSPVVIECELIEFVETENFTTVLGRVVNLAADETVLNEKGKIDTAKIGMIFYESFNNSYFTLGKKVGNAWGEGKVFMK